MKINGVQYYYEYNLQGDVIGLFDSTGIRVLAYTYDAWGKVTALTGTNLEIAYINPYRYRGYYYDQETKLYYLQSRYYDADTGRFLNADEASLLFVSDVILSLNHFTYCDNNSVNHVDQSGNRLYPKIIAFGIQLEISISFAEYGFEVVFAGGNIYLFSYGGVAYGKTLAGILDKLKFNFINMFSKDKFLKNAKKLFSANLSLCVFAVFSSRVKYFDPKKYKGPFIGLSTTIPTPYKVGAKVFVSTWDTYSCVGIGFSFPSGFDYSVSYTKYSYKGKYNISAAIRNFVNKQTKGLKAK